MSDDPFRPERSFAEITREIEAMREPRVVATRYAQRAWHWRQVEGAVEAEIVVDVDDQADAERVLPLVVAMPGERSLRAPEAIDMTAVKIGDDVIDATREATDQTGDERAKLPPDFRPVAVAVREK